MLKRIVLVVKLIALAVLVAAAGIVGWWYTFKPRKAPAAAISKSSAKGVPHEANRNTRQ